MPRDEDPPERTLSIEKFVEQLRTLFADERYPEFIHLALAGTYEDRQVVIDALASRCYSAGDEELEEDDLYPYDLSRDIDSVLGVSEHICVYGKNISFSLLPKHSESLSKDVGLSRKIRYNGVSLIANEGQPDSYLPRSYTTWIYTA